MHFAISNHGTLTLLEPLTEFARNFLRSLGFAPTKVTVTGRDFREIRYAARHAGFEIA